MKPDEVPGDPRPEAAAPAPRQRPSAGRIVLYTYQAAQEALPATAPDAEGRSRPATPARDLEIRPAIITRVWNDTCVDLTIFDAPGDDAHTGIRRVTSCVEGSPQEQGTWFWPPRV